MMSEAVQGIRRWMAHTTMNGNGRTEKGYMFASVMVMVVLLGISMGMLAKSWTYQVHRMKENELLFRGNQYARAIRSYYQTHRRYPYKLEELMQVRPRVLRKLYEDPMTSGGEWGMVYLDDIHSGVAAKPQAELPAALRVVGVDGAPIEPAPVEPEPSVSESGLETENDVETEPSAKVGQIVGVYSRSRQSAFRNFQKGKVYADWKFLGIMDASDSLKRMGMGSYNPALAKEAQ